MSKKELKKEFIELYKSMSNEEKEHLGEDCDGTLYIIDYAEDNGREDLSDAFDELTDEAQDEILDKIADLYYNEFDE